ncbi:hypothetical protein N9V22_00310 [Gammaproteobacteria bacterium]|nr:hypothetical protein [Gammaproteobacteria bacterium]
MIWVIRLYLLLMSVIYSWIGIWALIDPVAGALDLGWPSFSVAIGLSVTSEIGYSEIAGIYGGLNFCIGLACLLGIFKKDIGIFLIKFITFLVGSIALGRFLFSMLPTTPTFMNTFFLFEVCAFVIGMILLYSNSRMDDGDL